MRQLRTNARQRGVGLVEVLIALAISATLLTAVAVAIDASFKAYGVSESQAQLLQRGRLALNRITTYIRSTSQHLPDDDTAQTNFENGQIVQASSIRMMLDATNGVIFRQSDDELQMVAFTIAGSTLTEGTARMLVKGVGTNDFSITFEPQRSAQAIKTGGKYDQLKRASINLTIRPNAQTAVVGEEMQNETVNLSASIMPRKNIW
ncbi:MAG TPA: prepilin-type N-terminal cleavage/methylation domain-containing protein [Tepidisphaeraceae bacterium]|nr:prepilin-type N-terminal cleavage/methylation domain-containing protein [Tepidisphaeraceae bacterium]